MGDISEKKKLIIIGGGAVGMAVATRAQRGGGYHVMVISSDSHAAYSQCGIPFVLGRDIKDFDSLILRSPEFFEQMGIDIKLNTLVDSIDLEERTVITDGQKLPFDKLVIATGSVPFVPENISFERSLENVFTIRTLSDGSRVEKALKKARNLTIIGGGSIGVELAPCMASRGIKTTIVNRSDSILSHHLDPEMAGIVKEYMESIGIDVITGIVPESINGKEKVESVTIKGKKIPSDVVIFATGVVPQTWLAGSAGISIGNTGAIVVNEHLQARAGDTYLPDVFAGGECVEVPDLVTQEPTISQLASTARRMAGVIANNLYEKDSTLDPITNPWICVAGELQIGTVGLSGHDARQKGIEVVSGSSKGLTSAGYYTGSGQIFIRLLFMERYLAGAQIIADKGVKERIDGLAFAIKKRATVDEMMKMETCYAPPVSTLVDPIIYAVKDAHKKMEERN